MVSAIGGDLEFDPTLLEGSHRNLFDTRAYFSSGRAALDVILRKLQGLHSNLVAIWPSYLCQRIIKTLSDL